MTSCHTLELAQRACIFALSVALLSASTAFASPQAPTDSVADSTPSPTAQTRLPATDDPAIDIAVDESTEEFRTELAEKQAMLDEFNAQLDALDREMELATEQYNAAVDHLNSTKQQVQAVKEDLGKTQEAVEVQTDILGDRAGQLYRDGSVSAMEILLDSKGVSDFITRIKFLNTLGMRDADIVASLRAQKELLTTQAASLESAEAEAKSLEFELKARQIEIMLRVQERQEMLTQAQAELVTLLDEEASRRQGEEAELLTAIMSGASEAGIQVTSGSPVETALAYHGVPYVWGGESPTGFDCSGLVLYVFGQHGVTLPHYSGSQFSMGTKIPVEQLQPSDVVFFGSPIHHVGIYLGSGYYIHAPRTGDFVKISKLTDRKDYAGARRYDWQARVAEPTDPVSSIARALSSTPVEAP